MRKTHVPFFVSVAILLDIDMEFDSRKTRSAPPTPTISPFEKPSYLRTFSTFSRMSTESERVRKMQRYKRIFDAVSTDLLTIECN